MPKSHEDRRPGAVDAGTASAPESRMKDPVCGMSVNPATAKNKLEHAGPWFCFCNPRCLEKFRADPDAYLKPRPASPPVEPASATTVAEYTCPMHPEVVQIGPGTC